jgi:hypothetical protein
MSTMGGHGKWWTGESDERDWSCFFLNLSIISCSLFLLLVFVVSINFYMLWGIVCVQYNLRN